MHTINLQINRKLKVIKMSLNIEAKKLNFKQYNKKNTMLKRITISLTYLKDLWVLNRTVMKKTKTNITSI